MAKDPAFLFYSQDFFIGTIDFTPQQVGYYVRLMCLQHQKGHLSKALMTATMDGLFDETIAAKFVLDENGLYYNKRLEVEIERRNSYTESRRSNAKPKHMDKHMQQHMNDHMETATVTVTNNVSRTKSTDVPTPLLTDSETQTLVNDQNEVLNEAERSGFPKNAATQDDLISLLAEHGKEAVLEGIKKSRRQNVPTIAYLMGCLKNKGDKKQPGKPPPGKGYSNPFIDDLKARGVIP